MTPEELRACCLEQNGAWEDYPFPGHPGLATFKVGKKIFALSALDEDPLRVSLKCDPEIAVRLRESYPAVRPGWHLNKRHWNTVTLDGSVPDVTVREMVEDSYDLVVAGLPRWERLRLGQG
ncbi:MmcQ/YjbR family DNA-binding protein [Streptomyces sp. CA-250714]|uniref:MmcQ/YjbR family DNA-binding protein n=1 Tax=Streptomyces sp. CA-250714 TaxID=3240060 RepID=UPI003D931320